MVMSEEQVTRYFFVLGEAATCCHERAKASTVALFAHRDRDAVTGLATGIARRHSELKFIRIMSQAPVVIALFFRSGARQELHQGRVVFCLLPAA